MLTGIKSSVSFKNRIVLEHQTFHALIAYCIPGNIRFKKFSWQIQYKSMKSILINETLSYYFLGISDLYFMKSMSQTIALTRFLK